MSPKKQIQNLTHKHQGAYSAASTVATDALVLKHQAISTHSTVPLYDQFD